jgi:hypothetical protein
MNNRRDLFIQHLRSRYNSIDLQTIENAVSSNLICNEEVIVSKENIKKIKNFIQATFELKQSENYQNYLIEKYQYPFEKKSHHSLFMSYDFHIDQNQEPKLIEINTNAAFWLLGYELYQLNFKKDSALFCDLEELKRNFQEEYSLSQKKEEIKSIQIVDEKTSQQRMLIEFLCFNDLFKSWGWKSDISDVDQLKSSNFIYNRHTDFYFTNSVSHDLKKVYEDGSACVSPHPFEYFLLADKERIVDWSESSFLNKFLNFESSEVIRKVIPISQKITLENSEEIWKQRKYKFFKPMRSFGSKQSYKGASVSKKIFEECVQQGFIAQDYIQPEEVEVKTEQGLEKMKYDLRCYVYKNKLQMIIARVYQGQVTNLRTPFGGFTTCLQK